MNKIYLSFQVIQAFPFVQEDQVDKNHLFLQEIREALASQVIQLIHLLLSFQVFRVIQAPP